MRSVAGAGRGGAGEGECLLVDTGGGAGEQQGAGGAVEDGAGGRHAETAKHQRGVSVSKAKFNPDQ